MRVIYLGAALPGGLAGEALSRWTCRGALREHDSVTKWQSLRRKSAQRLDPLEAQALFASAPLTCWVVLVTRNNSRGSALGNAINNL